MNAIINFIVSLFVRPIDLEATCECVSRCTSWTVGFHYGVLYVWDKNISFVYMVTPYGVKVDKDESGYRPVPKTDEIWDYIKFK